jgi:hypothetical protein
MKAITKGQNARYIYLFRMRAVLGDWDIQGLVKF